VANLGAEFPLNSTTGDKFSPAVAALPDGRFVATWTNNNVIQARLFKADGTPVDGDFTVAGPSADGSLVPVLPKVAALPDGHFVVTWLSHDSLGDGSGRVVRARLYDSDGTAATRQSRAEELF
jgi:hypothetical protein